jgi:hypothetical protein
MIERAMRNERPFLPALIGAIKVGAINKDKAVHGLIADRRRRPPVVRIALQDSKGSRTAVPSPGVEVEAGRRAPNGHPLGEAG